MIMLMSIISLNLFAQTRVDRFDSYDAMVGKEVRLYNVVSMAEHQGYFAYNIDGDKPKVIKSSGTYQELEQNNIHIGEIVKRKKSSYLKVLLRGEYIYLKLDRRFNYLANARSVSYWAEKNDALVTTYSHLRADSNILFGDYEAFYKDVVLSEYVAISWMPISIPSNINEEVLFGFTINGGYKKVYELSYNLIEQYKSDFVTPEQFSKAQEAYNIAHPKSEGIIVGAVVPNSDEVDKYRVFEADIKLTDSAKRILDSKEIDYEMGFDLLFSVYSITTKTTGSGYSKKTSTFVKGYLLGHNIELPEDSVLFRHTEDKEYLKSRGYEGEAIRRQVAEENDATYSAVVLQWIRDYTKELQYKIEKTQSYYKSKGILIIDQGYSYSDYQFGLVFKFYNCYSKDIKYIDITVCAYNQVMDRQRDDFGRHTTEARCIGPILPTETGSYDFDELFWDDNDIIDKLQVEKIVVTFMDNTTRTYSGKSQVDRLRLDSYPPVNLDGAKGIKVGKATDFKNFVTSIDWQWTEAELITHLGYKVKRCKRDEWKDENSESNYKLDNVTVCGIPVVGSNIRVDKTTRKLYRMNIFVLDDATDLTLSPKIEQSLVAELGQPTKKNITNDRRDFIWECDGYVIEATYWDLSNASTEVVENYSYIISIEPR